MSSDTSAAVFRAAIQTLREQCRVEAECKASGRPHRLRHRAFMEQLDRALEIWAPAPRPDADLAEARRLAATARDWATPWISRLADEVESLRAPIPHFEYVKQMLADANVRYGITVTPAEAVLSVGGSRDELPTLTVDLHFDAQSLRFLGASR